MRLTDPDDSPAKVIVYFVRNDTDAILHLLPDPRALEQQRMSSSLVGESGGRRDCHARRTGNRASCGQVVSRSIGVDPLESDLLHLTDGPAIIGDYTPFVYLPDNQRRCLHARDSIREDNLTAICIRLRSP